MAREAFQRRHERRLAAAMGEGFRYRRACVDVVRRWTLPHVKW